MASHLPCGSSGKQPDLSLGLAQTQSLPLSGPIFSSGSQACHRPIKTPVTQEKEQLAPNYKRKSELSKLINTCLNVFKILLRVNNQLQLNTHIVKCMCTFYSFWHMKYNQSTLLPPSLLSILWSQRTSPDTPCLATFRKKKNRFFWPFPASAPLPPQSCSWQQCCPPCSNL